MIRYTDSIAQITSGSLRGFFVGWPNPPSPEMHLRLIANSTEAMMAIDDETGNVVGFITALTDNVLSAYISFLEVLPEYQDHGIGQELMRLMIEKLCGLYVIDTVCDSDTKDFYAKFGMKPSDAMVFRRHEHWSGEQASGVQL